jgi:hypothetical protein
MSTRLPRTLLIGDVARILYLPVRYVERMAADGLIPHILLPGGELLFDEVELCRWLDQRRYPLAASRQREQPAKEAVHAS